MNLWRPALRLIFCSLVASLASHCQEAFGDEPNKETSIKELPITDGDREHWSFQPVKLPAVPVVRRGDWVRNSVDAFILAKLEQQNLEPAPEAERATLLRRLTFDLTGLPPSLEELSRFEQDSSPAAYQREVERLLTSPAYGERWAQAWLDLARFAESDGFEHDKVRPDAWKYRDWVIAAFNRDLPYDRFVREQLAGDVLTGGEAVATMFCLAGPDMPDINDQRERRHVLLNELTSTVGSVLLGLQVGCAQCHDHKYDPLSQADFYRLRAVFESAVTTLKRDVPYNLLQQQTEVAPARLWIRGDHRRPGAEVRPGFPRIANYDPVATLSPAQARPALADWLFQPQQPLTARVMVNRVWQQHFGRGLADTPSDFGLLGSEPSHPELLDWLACEFRAQGWSIKQLHRLIVTSATYRQASRASDGDKSWSMRLEHDPANKWYGRASRRRLEGESLRDAMLASAGILATERGGPGVMPPLAEELLNTLLKDQWTASEREADHYRRSIYIFARRNLRYPLFDAFDRPPADASCPVRNRSTTATQSLVLLNSEFSLLVARHLVGAAWAHSPDTNKQVEFLYRRCFSRHPTQREVETLATFLARQRALLTAEARPAERLALPINLLKDADRHAAAALVDASLALLNSSEFLYLD